MEKNQCVCKEFYRDLSDIAGIFTSYTFSCPYHGIVTIDQRMVSAPLVPKPENPPRKFTMRRLSNR